MGVVDYSDSSGTIMPINRIFVLAGSLAAAAGAACLTFFGSAPVEVFEMSAAARRRPDGRPDWWVAAVA